MTTTEITIHGRGGQGVQAGARLLAAALFRAGFEVQEFASYGGERRGVPITAAVRISDSELHLHSDVVRPQYALVLDASLIEGPGRCHRDRLLVVNSPAEPCSLMPDALRTIVVDASDISQRAGLGEVVAPAVLGAFAAATGLLTLDDLLAAADEWSPENPEATAAACTEGFLGIPTLAEVPA